MILVKKKMTPIRPLFAFKFPVRRFLKRQQLVLHTVSKHFPRSILYLYSLTRAVYLLRWQKHMQFKLFVFCHNVSKKKCIIKRLHNVWGLYSRTFLDSWRLMGETSFPLMWIFSSESLKMTLPTLGFKKLSQTQIRIQKPVIRAPSAWVPQLAFKLRKAFEEGLWGRPWNILLFLGQHKTGQPRRQDYSWVGAYEHRRHKLLGACSPKKILKNRTTVISCIAKATTSYIRQ